MPYQNLPIEVLPGIQSIEDFTPQSTPHFVAGDKVRFVDGFPEKIGGWRIITPSMDKIVNGCPRLVFSYLNSGNINYIIGTHSHLYNLLGSTLTNITPVLTSTTTLNNVLSTFYGTLANDPIATVSGSAVITVTDTAHRLLNGDSVTFSGSTAVNGITAGEINTTHMVANVTTNTYEISTTGSATSTGSGGGAAVVRATRIVTVTDTNDFINGDNIEISNLGVAVGGIPAGSINGLRRIRNVTGSDYDIVADDFATSAVSGAGGSIDIAEQIAEGVCDPTVGVGYGLGLYGVGLYGVAKTASSPTLPSIYSIDRFGNLYVFTRGTQTELYSWTGDVDILPIIVANAPTAINYTFVSNEIVVTLGADGVGNRIQWSDQGDQTVWTATATNRAGQDDIEGASSFISHAKVRGFNILFTSDQVYTFRYIDRPFIWQTQLLDPSRGIIAQNARVVVNGICYWMGKENFYMYSGGNVEIIPSNTITQSTIKKFVFENVDDQNQSKIFAWYNEAFSEIWWHYPTTGNDEPNQVAVYNIRNKTWATHTLSRTAGEYPAILTRTPILMGVDSSDIGIIYQHEDGNDDNTDPLQFTLTTPFFNNGTDMTAIGALHFDSIKNGDITVQLNTKRYPKSTLASTNYTITDTTDKIVFKRRARYWQYIITGNVLDQAWRAGIWYEERKASGRK